MAHGKGIQTELSTVGLERIAFASSRIPNSDWQERWTELVVYHRPGQRRPFLAESLGRTILPGEKQFLRQRVGKSVEEVCRLFDNSRLHDEIIEKAQAWLDAHPDLAATEPAKIQFNGAGALRGALLWLYPDLTRDASDSAMAARLQADFGIPMRTVRHTLKLQTDKKPLPSWCLAFLGALMHFDREAFHNARRK